MKSLIHTLTGPSKVCGVQVSQPYWCMLMSEPCWHAMQRSRRLWPQHKPRSPHGDHLTQLTIFKQLPRDGRSMQVVQDPFLNAREALNTALRVSNGLEVWTDTAGPGFLVC
jgi:hypothetical protein